MRAIVAKSARDPRWVNRNGVPALFPPFYSGAARRPIAKADQAEIERLANNQRQLTGQIRRAFLDNVRQLQNQIDLDRLARLLREGRVSEAQALVSDAISAQNFRPFGDAVSTAALTAGQNAADALGELNISFSVTNPATMDFLRTYEMGLIRGLSSDALQSVRTVITAGIGEGSNPLDIARDVRDFIGLTDRQTQAVLNYRSALESGSSDALSRALRDQRFDPTVQRAIDGEATLSGEQIDNMVARYGDRYLRYRSETIARTEATRALNTGNNQLWRQAISNGQVASDQITRRWVFTHDDRTRHAHRTIPEMNPDGVGMDEPFQSELGPIRYPGDPDADPANTINCRCTVVTRYSVSDDEEESDQ